MIRGQGGAKSLRDRSYSSERGGRFSPASASRWELLVIVRGAFEEGTKLPRARRVTQLAQRLGFDLANAFARDGEGLADFLERVFAAIVEPESHLDDFFLARRESFEHRGRLFLQAQIDHGI